MNTFPILFDAKGHAFSAGRIRQLLVEFGDKYNSATGDIIRDSRVLDADGQVFVKCAMRILSSFGMTRSGRFQGSGAAGKANIKKVLSACWGMIGDQLLAVNGAALASRLSRERYLLELSQAERDQVIAEVWDMTKRLLPFTMSKSSYGLVGASKIVFSVLPEIALPIDNVQWREVFKTVDLGDVIKRMAAEIERWESVTGSLMNELDSSGRLTTLPSVYNVVAMDARPKRQAAKRET
jgi:hypothetical protein